MEWDCKNRYQVEYADKHLLFERDLVFEACDKSLQRILQRVNTMFEMFSRKIAHKNVSFEDV